MVNIISYLPIYIMAMSFVMGDETQDNNEKPIVEPPHSPDQSLECAKEWNEKRPTKTATCVDMTDKSFECEMAFCSYWKATTTTRLAPGGDNQMDYLDCLPTDKYWKPTSDIPHSDVFVQHYVKNYTRPDKNKAPQILLRGMTRILATEEEQAYWLCEMDVYYNRINTFCDPKHCKPN